MIPISKNAKELAEERFNAQPNKSSDNSSIPCSRIIIRNRGEKNTSWKGYDYWTEKDDDPIIPLPSGTEVSNLNKGKWLKLTANSESLCVWLTTDKFETTDKLISIPAPECHIVDKEGKYQKHAIWFGVCLENIDNRGQYPFLSVNSVGLKQSKDFPIEWYNEPRAGSTCARNDDIFKVIEEKKSLSHDVWTSDCPLNKISVDIGDKVKNIQQSFENADDILRVLLIREHQIKENDEKVCYYNIFYTRSFKLDKKLSDTLGEVTELRKRKWQIKYRVFIFDNQASVLQVCRVEQSNILLRVHKFSTNNSKPFNDLWNETASAVVFSKSRVNDSNALALAPLINTNGDSTPRSIIHEWRIRSKNCNNGFSNFELEGNTISGNSLRVDLELPLVKTSFKSEAIKISNVKFTSVKHTKSLADNGTLLLFELENGKVVGDNIVLRDGSISIELAIKTDLQKFGRFRLTLQNRLTQTPFYLWQWHKGVTDIVVNYAIDDFKLPVKSIQAAGQERLSFERFTAPQSIGAVNEGRGENSEPALVIPLTVLQKEQKAFPPLTLAISESTNVGQDHRITMKLLAPNRESMINNSVRNRVVVIDTNPQFVGLVDTKLVQQSGYDNGEFVVAVREEEGGWRFLDDDAETEGFKLVLPSQAIGEAYVKSDCEVGGDNNLCSKIKKGEPQANEPIEYRFGAPAMLRLAPERLEKRFVRPAWSLRALWGAYGEVSPGIPMLEAQFELLYGLQAHLLPDQNTTLAELGAKIGEVPVPPKSLLAWDGTSEQSETFKEKWKEYVNFYRAWKARIAVLEPIKEDKFANTEFKSGISFGPRIELSETKDTDGKPIYSKKKGASLRLPVDLVELNDDLIEKIKKAHETEGLAGGFHYGFESAAVYKELWRELLGKGSSSGEVDELAFTSQGGYGRQAARFAGDKTVIKSITKMGRTHFYAVERIGRIGVFWHKAKHVIEYERTVVPSEQFASTQPKHLGRPLVRKVREYVEILEPERSYPDFGINPPDSPGAVKNIVFKSKIIPVLSSWGRDVWGDDNAKHTTIGWEVPLWKPGADPKLYPKPQVQMGLTPPPDADLDTVWVNLSEPENLVFYTDTREKVGDIFIDAEVHKWPAVLHVDYTNLPDPQHYDIAPALANDLDLIDAQLPDALEVPPGFERYTFRVDRSEIPAAVAIRYHPKSAVIGRLKTVSMVRGGAGNEDWWESQVVTNNTDLEKYTKAKSALKKLRQPIKLSNGNIELPILAELANGFSEIDKSIFNGQRLNDIQKFFTTTKTQINKIREDVAALNDVSDPKLSDDFNGLWKKSSLKQRPTKLLWRESLVAADGMVNKVLSYYDEQSKNLITELEQIQQREPAFIPASKVALQKFKEQLSKYHTGIEFSIDSASSSIYLFIDKPISGFEDSLNKLLVDVNQLIDEIYFIENDLQAFEDKRSKVKNIIAGKINTIQDGFKNLKATLEKNKKLKSIALEHGGKAIEKLNSFSVAVEKLLDDTQNSIQSVSDAKKNIREIINAHHTEILKHTNSIKQNASIAIADSKNTFTEINKRLYTITSSIISEIENGITKLENEWNAGKENFIAVAKRILLKSKDNEKPYLRERLRINVLISSLKVVLKDSSNSPTIYSELEKIDSVFGQITDLGKKQLLEVLEGTGWETEFEKWFNGLEPIRNLSNAISQNDVSAILRESRALANTINKELGRLAGEVAQKITDIERTSGAGLAVLKEGKQTLRNMHSVWEEFSAPGMGFNRKTIALIVNANPKDIQQRLSITPVMARVKQFGNELDGLGLRLPTVAITDRLLSARKEFQNAGKSLINNFDFSNVLSDIGGMRLDRMFPGLKMPAINRDNIKITQGFDKQQLMAWVNAEADIKLGSSEVLLNFGPLKISFLNGRFKANTRLQISAGERQSKSSYGEMRGTFAIEVAGLSLMQFVDTKITFRNGRTDVDLDPKRMQMPGLLQLITDATQNIPLPQPPDVNTGPFYVGIHKEKGIPAGVVATLNIPPLNIGGGPTALTNLSFGAQFMLTFLNKSLKPEFMTSFAFNVGRKEAPFNLTVFILGGGGYISFQTYYKPMRSIGSGMKVDFAMSVHASVGLAISAGFMSGGVLICLGFEGRYTKEFGGSGRTHISIFVLVVGHVEILSIVSVHLSLLLQVTYSTGGGKSQMIGMGQVKLTIKLTKFIKIKVNKSYTKVLAGSKQQAHGITKSEQEKEKDRQEKANKILATLN